MPEILISNAPLLLSYKKCKWLSGYKVEVKTNDIWFMYAFKAIYDNMLTTEYVKPL